MDDGHVRERRSHGHAVAAYEEEIPDGANYVASGGSPPCRPRKTATAPAEGEFGGETNRMEYYGTYEYTARLRDERVVGTVTVAI